VGPAATTRLPEIIKRREQDLLERLIKEQLGAVILRRDLLSESARPLGTLPPETLPPDELVERVQELLQLQARRPDD
jgi:hypothetical protein